MQTFHTSLIELVLQGVVERDVAANAASNQHDFLVALEHAIKERRAREAESAAAEAAPRAPTLVPGAGALRVAGSDEAAASATG